MGGGWNAHPGAARQLLMQLEKDSAISVNLKRVLVDLERDDIAAYPEWHVIKRFEIGIAIGFGTN